MPRIVDHDERREQIARATLQTVRRLGLEKTTLREIAREGRFTSGLLIYYFRSRDDILEYAFQWLARREIAALEAMLQATSAVDAIRAIADYLVPTGPGRRRHPLALWAGMSAYRNVLKSYDAFKNRIAELLGSALRAEKAGETTPGRIEENIDIFLMALEGLLLAMNLHPRKYDGDHVNRIKLRLIADLRDY